MPKRNKQKAAVIVTDGTEHGAHVLFTDLVVCERVGDIFHAGGRSANYERRGAMTAEYVRQLVDGLGRLLAEYDAERGCVAAAPIDDIALAALPCGQVQFTLKRGIDVAGVGAVTESVAYKAKCFLDTLFDGPNIVRLRRPM